MNERISELENPANWQAIQFEDPLSKTPGIAVYLPDFKKMIGGGLYGMVFRVRMRPLDGKIRTDYPTVIIKVFKYKDKEADAINARDAFRLLKKYGAPTWATYEKVAGQPWIVMSDGERHFNLNTVVWAQLYPSDSLKKLKGKAQLNPEGQLPITNLVSAIKSAAEETKKLASLDIYVHRDAWFGELTSTKDGTFLIKFTIKDLDNVILRSQLSGRGITKVPEDNVSLLKFGLQNLLCSLPGVKRDEINTLVEKELIDY